MLESECGALVGPRERNPSEQELDGQRSGLTAFDDGLDNVGRKKGKAQEPSDMCIAETEAPGNFGGVGIFALS